jgi:RNA polymerase sigma factor (sigma-70 family)
MTQIGASGGEGTWGNMALASTGPSQQRGGQAGAGDNPLLAAFLEKRQNLVLYLAARVRSMATAEDLAQDLYLKVAALEPGAEVRAPTALLYRMAANLLVDHLRSDQRGARRSAQWRLDTRATLGGEDVVEEPPADEALIARERVRQLAEAVADLPPQMGRAFRLHKLEGMSQAEAAQAMGVSRKMIEQHVAAAIRRLAERLRP